ncbi:MAG TPA: hypothetical protein VN577_23370 [Terriglobales bacterium]|nr:hypothetical protein [Terriglobales bacterium]
MAAMRRNMLVGVLAIVAAAAAIAIAMLLVDINNDRQYRVRITGPVRLYDPNISLSRHSREDGVVDMLTPSNDVKVLRIRFGDDYEAIRVRLADGREGYLFCCDNFELSK